MLFLVLLSLIGRISAAPAPDIFDILNSLTSNDDDDEGSTGPTGSPPSTGTMSFSSSEFGMEEEDLEGCSYLGVQFPVGYQMEADCGLCTCTAGNSIEFMVSKGFHSDFSFRLDS